MSSREIQALNHEKERFDKELTEALERGHGPLIARFALACLGGVPVVGGVFGGVAGGWSEKEQNHYNRVFASWLRLQEDELKEIAQTIAEILSRLNLNNENIQKRIESPEYLSLLKKCFRDWSAAESEQKRVFIRNLLINAAAHKLCSDDVVRMFIKWIDIYSDFTLCCNSLRIQNRWLHKGRDMARNSRSPRARGLSRSRPV